MQIILHLTDIHFGYEHTNLVGIAERKVCLDSLVVELKNLEPEWKPTVICLTGDIGWGGNASDYKAAKAWLDILLEACGLTYQDVVVCAGNHDVFRSAAKALARPKSASEADEVLGALLESGNEYPYERPFSHFIAFCKETGIPDLTLGTTQSYLVGQRTINGIRFIVLNSAWFSKDNYDERNLWIGLPHLIYMESQSQLPLLNTAQDTVITIGIIHHPPKSKWLHDEEQHAWGTRYNSVDYLAKRCHILLSGHTHGEIRHPDTIAQGTLHFTGGATYAERAYFNSIKLLRVHKDKVEYRSLEYDPRSIENTWRSGPADTAVFPHSQHTVSQPLHTQTSTISQSLVKLREAARADAWRYLERKSRLLRQTGTLPNIIDRPVSIRVSIQHDQYNDNGDLIRPKDTEQQMPLYDAVRESRRTLLLGDLGTGKSTLAARLVMNTIDRSDNTEAVIIPAKMLQLPARATQRDLLSSIDSYVTGQIWPRNSDVGISHLLSDRVEVLLVLDGLDELPRNEAARLLTQAAILIENWPTIQVVCTARPVELVGVSFAEWTIANTVALDDSAKYEFIKQELIADGRPEETVDEQALTLLTTLQGINALDAIAISPLSIRLIYPRLASLSTTEQVSLGDLLYDLLVERLDGWQKRDDKPNTYLYFEQSFPTAITKAEYLAVLADRAVAGGKIGNDEAIQIFIEAASGIPNAQPHQLASEALAFYEWLGLVTVGDVVEFPLQPLAEICAGIGLIAQWRMNTGNGDMPSKDQWRIVSFAAAIIRRRGLLGVLRESLSSYIISLLQDPSYITAVCYIVAEAADATLAQKAVSLFNNFDRHPLTLFHEEWNTSARNVAMTLVLAGDVGFDWLFDHYLNPIYPIPHAGSAHIQGIFTEWATLIRPSLSDTQKRRLRTLVLPYEATGEANFYGVLSTLSTLIPEAFSPEQRISHHLTALGNPRFSEWSKQQISAAWANDEVHQFLERALLQRAQSSSHAARLWLEWNPGIDPPYPIVCLALASGVKLNASSNDVAVAQQCYEQLGSERWLRFARWAIITEERQVAAGAVKALYDAGERRLSILGDAILNAMHDGGYVPYAEEILAVLIDNLGEQGVRWLAKRIAQAQESDKAHSGWWRVLLSKIEMLDDGPEVLASCIRALGEFIIPRYPEIRRSFEQLLTGTQGSLFHNALRNTLSSLDPAARHGAAIILISVFPHTEAEALFVAIRSRPERRYSNWGEWETFCLSLNFGPSVLVSLKSRLKALTKQSRALALVILIKGGVDLGEEYRSEVIESISKLGNWHLRRESASIKLLNTQASFDELVEQLEQADLSKAHESAKLLLEFHRSHLEPPQEALCTVLTNSNSLGIWVLQPLMFRIAHDQLFAQQIMDASEVVRKRGGAEPILGIIAKAITKGTGWKDVIWQLLCNSDSFGGIGEVEGYGMALLEFGLSTAQYRADIGQFAKICLNDPRMIDNRWHETNQWLALLADEFDELTQDDLRAAILCKDPIHYGALTALIARLGEVPEGFSCKRAERKEPIDLDLLASKVRDTQQIIHCLMDYARDSQELHPHILDTIADCLFLEPIAESALVSIAAIGKPGILISTMLRFVYDIPHKMGEMIPLLEVWYKIRNEGKHKPHIKKLARVWYVARELAFHEDDQTRTDYLTYLNQALLEDNIWKLAITSEIFEIQGSLANEQIPIVFTEYAERDSLLHPLLFIRICDWLSGRMNDISEAAVARAAENAVMILDEAPWQPTEHELNNTWANLLFPMIIWAYTEESSPPSEAVFFRGIRSIFDYLPDSSISFRPALSDILPKLEPMLSRVPPTILGNVVVNGVESLEPSVSAFCRLIAAFSKEPTVK